MSNVPESERPSEARLRHQLDVQAQQINRVLSHHQVPASVTGGTVHSRVVQFNLQTQIHAGIERIRGLKDDLITALGVNDVAVSRENDRWQLNVSRPDDPPVPLLKLLASTSSLPPRTIPIGLADGGQPVLLNFPTSRMSHIMIAGDKGAGKTSLLRAMATAIAMTTRQAQCQLQIIDPAWNNDEQPTAHDSPLLPLGYLPHMLSDPAFGMDSGITIIEFLDEEMTYRHQQSIQTPHLIIFIDHLETFLEHAGTITKSAFIRLLQYGSRTGIHLVMATERPDSPYIDSTIKSCFSIRIAGRIKDNTAARRFGGATLEQASMLYGEGDFLISTGDKVTYFQAAHIGDYDLHHALFDLARPAGPRLLAHQYSAQPRVTFNKASGQTPPVTFSVRGGVVDIGNETLSTEIDDPDSIPF